MRSIWNGAVTFGLVSVPVKLYSATEEHDAPLHQVHAADGGRIRYKRVCEICGKEIAYADIARAFEEDGRSVILKDEELAHLPAETNREIEVIEFVASSEVDSIRLSKSYYLEPASKSAKPYLLLRKALEQTDRTAIVRVALRNKSRLAALRPYGEVLLLQTLLWDDEIRTPDFPSIDSDIRISAQELKLSGQLVDSLSQPFQPADFRDEYQEQLRALIESKLSKRKSKAPAPAEGSSDAGDAQVIDLMEALRRSVAQSKAGTPASAARGAAEKSTPRRKAANGDKEAAKAKPRKRAAKRAG